MENSAAIENQFCLFELAILGDYLLLLYALVISLFVDFQYLGIHG